MGEPRPAGIPLIRDLVGFPTVSRVPNRDLLAYVEAWLKRHGVATEIIWNADRSKGNLWATIGPDDRRGVILSGHSDVVPVEGQAWTADPFSLREDSGRLYGRGACDMKGFLGVVLALVPEMAHRPLRAPVHLAISYDEEVGCVGVGSLIDHIAGRAVKPALCIVGEPTGMQPVIAHKGGRGYRVRVTGKAAHSSLAPKAVNAVEYAAELVVFLRRMADRWAADGPFDADYDVAHSTLSTGVVSGGTAINIVPESCNFLFEFRHLAGVDADDVVRRIRAFADSELAPAMQAVDAGAGIVFEPVYDYPGLDVVADHPAVGLVKRLAGRNDHGKVAYGTEAGLFMRRGGIVSIVCGPGHIAQAHRADEYVSLEQIALCERFLRRLLDHLEQAPGSLEEALGMRHAPGPRPGSCA